MTTFPKNNSLRCAFTSQSPQAEISCTVAILDMAVLPSLWTGLLKPIGTDTA